MGVALLDPHGRAKRDTIAALEDLFIQAQAGHVTGIAYVVLRPERRYAVGVAGVLRKTPLLTRGLLMLLDDELARMTRGLPPE